MKLKVLHYDEAIKLFEDHNLLNKKQLATKQLASLRKELSRLSVDLKRKEGFPDLDLNIIESLLEECMTNFNPKEDPLWSMENWLAPRLHNALRLTKQEATQNEVWFFLGLYFYNFILWRHSYPGKTTAKLLNVTFGLPLTKMDRQIFSRCWWMSEITRLGKKYSSNAIINGDYVNQILEVDTHQMRGHSYFIGEFYLANKMDRLSFRTFSYLVRQVIVPRPFTSFAEEIEDIQKYREWLQKKPIKKDVLKVSTEKIVGPDDYKFITKAKSNMNEWFEIVWESTQNYYEVLDNLVEDLLKDKPEIEKAEVIKEIKKMISRKEETDISNSYKKAIEK